MLESKDYYIDLINSTKANVFTCRWHYSKVGFKKAKINQGIYRKTDNLLVGVLQWGVSAQEGIKLNRYVKEPISKEEYLELNRFCMADSEPRNAESQAISLGIKWLKQNRKDIKLLVSYAGRKEGNYGFIYQATNWEYLGYFISDGFWELDGQERHQITLWYTYQHHTDRKKPFKEAICDLYSSVKQTWSKQFIYIKRLDKRLHPASEILPYPKEKNEYPIVTRTEVYKDLPYTVAATEQAEVEIYYSKDEQLFTRRTLIRRGELIEDDIAIYDRTGLLLDSCHTCTDAAALTGMSIPSVSSGLKTGKLTKGFFFRNYPSNEEPADQIEVVGWVCEIDGLRFLTQKEVAEYCGISRQAVSYAKLHNGKHLGGKEVIWNNND